jgi:NAD(P)H-hydrate epimerase
MIGALACQGLTPFDAAVLGVRLHVLAGEIASELLTSTCVIATDVIEAIPAAVRRLGAGE